MNQRTRLVILFTTLLGASGCLRDDAYGPSSDAGLSLADAGASGRDAGDTPRDAGSGVPRDGGVITGSGYGHVAPPAGPPAMVLRSQTWLDHFEDDLLPYWTSTEARGTPTGNFPTYRGMNGTVQQPSERRPRMLGRQTFLYSMGYLMTGNNELLGLAKAGANWIVEHAHDDTNDGWHARLSATGDPLGSDPKLAQDTAYVMQGLAAYYFVTRDPAVEQVILETRDLLFDPATYWDATNKRIKDGLDTTLSTEVDHESDGGWELVAQLDPINAFMLLVQPVLTEAARRTQFLDDLETLAQTLLDVFFSDGIFWGVHNKHGAWTTRHVDFGHTLKTYWMVLQIDKRLDDHPFQAFLQSNVHTWVTRAYDEPNGRWAKRPTSATNNEYGSDWWIYAEADQIAATLNLIDYRYSDELESTLANWIGDYVDTNSKEVIPGINRLGGPVYAWPANDTAKCNLWKNGYHSTEHALIMYLLGANLEGQPAALHFAVPAAIEDTFVARPYFFNGSVDSRTNEGTVVVDGTTLTKVLVQFVDLY